VPLARTIFEEAEQWTSPWTEIESSQVPRQYVLFGCCFDSRIF